MQLLVGLDVGSTTVKAVVQDISGRVLWRDYRRHDAQQAATALEFLRRMEEEAGLTVGEGHIFLTGSGSGTLVGVLGARFVQEVNALALAVEKLHPEVNSVIELGGQDAKILHFRQDPSGRRKKIATMNDKCAGGTGAVIDKISAKLCIEPDELAQMPYNGVRLHPVAGKCGVFAETDINGLQKLGLPRAELIASLFDALVLQNLTVLARGHALEPHVLLLGGPNAFLLGLRQAWQHRIPALWKERGIVQPAGLSVEELIRAPEDALYYAALGAIEFGRSEEREEGLYRGTEPLADLVECLGRSEKSSHSRAFTQGLCATDEEQLAFQKNFAVAEFEPAKFQPGQHVRAFLGIDGGSTSTKAVLLSEEGAVLDKSYQLSKGNPVEDSIDVLGRLREGVRKQGAHLEILGVGTTGYAKEILSRALQADVAVVETVAHTEAAKHFFTDPQAIIDVGGQDIKIILLRNGAVRDFKLNTQCSAGNGYFLQATAESFGVSVDQYAGEAFRAQSMPAFSYGCAVFLQSDIVEFQRQGWQAHEILAGLAAVLPRNVFLHVAKTPNLTALGQRFVLQGGTQRNLAAVKAQTDFLYKAFQGSGITPEIAVHPHCGESGAIGAALESMRLWRKGKSTEFIGMDAAAQIQFTAHSDEQTRCNYCTNHCMRTFLEIGSNKSADSRRVILATCEKGAAEDIHSLREVQAHLSSVQEANPNLVDWAAREVWRSTKVEPAAAASHNWNPNRHSHLDWLARRAQMRIGIPRVLSLYAYAPLFSAYFETLGIKPENLVYSDFTSGEMYRAGSSRGSIDPCFPSKIAIAHMHNLLFDQHARTPLDAIFLPMFDVLATPFDQARASNGCPTASITPETVEAAFTRESDLFAEQGIRYIHPLVNLAKPRLLARQLWHALEPLLGVDEQESERAVEIAFHAQERYEQRLRQHGREVIEQVEREGRLAVVLLGRPYHHDPGIHHGIPEEFQKLGYPVLSQSSLPMDDDLLERLFGDEVREGIITSPLDISDVWKTTFSANSNQKLWAAKFVARHPNLVALEFSSFKCGHDAPIYTVIEQIMQCSGTPYFGFKDMDENRPANTIKLRVETMDYFLRRYREERFGINY